MKVFVIPYYISKNTVLVLHPYHHYELKVWIFFHSYKSTKV